MERTAQAETRGPALARILAAMVPALLAAACPGSSAPPRPPGPPALRATPDARRAPRWVPQLAHARPFQRTAVSPDGQLAATVDADRRWLGVWDVRSKLQILNASLAENASAG